MIKSEVVKQLVTESKTVIDYRDGLKYSVKLTMDTEIDIKPPPVSDNIILTIIFVQDDIGGHKVKWPSTLRLYSSKKEISNRIPRTILINGQSTSITNNMLEAVREYNENPSGESPVDEISLCDLVLMLQDAGLATCYAVTDTEGWWTLTDNGRSLHYSLLNPIATSLVNLRSKSTTTVTVYALPSGLYANALYY
jgi:hypothetical protein